MVLYRPPPPLQASFRARKAQTHALHSVFVVMVRPFDSTGPPKVYHMYILEDFLAFFNAPPTNDDPCLIIDPNVLSEKPTKQQPARRLQIANKFLVEDFFEQIGQGA